MKFYANLSTANSDLTTNVTTSAKFGWTFDIFYYDEFTPADSHTDFGPTISYIGNAQLGEAANAMCSLSFVESDIGDPARATGDVAFALEKFRQIGFSSDIFSEKGFVIYIERSLDKLYEWQVIMKKGLTPIDTMLELNEVTEYSMYDGWSSNHDIAYLK